MPEQRLRVDDVAMTRAGRQVGLVGWPQETNVLLAAAWAERGIPVELLEPEEALARLGPGDVAVSRIDVLSTLDGLQPGLDELRGLVAHGVRLVNRVRPLLAAHDKLVTARILAAAGVPHPRTVHVVSVDDRVELAPPLVVKPRFGSWGVDVFRCDTAAELAQVLTAVRGRSWFVKHGALVQELLPPVGHDLRLVVAGGRVVGAMERVARPGEWRTNVSLGGLRRPASPSESSCALGVRAAAATGLEFVGIDLFPVRGTHVVLELNAAVEFDSGYDLWGGDVYEAAADALQLPRVGRALVAVR
jgi:RimK family alpha-L-glutamate ligase